MTIDEAKYNLNNKALDIKRLLRNRKIEILEVMRESILHFNTFKEPKELYHKVIHDLYREVKQLIGYIYLHELDELKRKKLAMYFVMQYSFSDFKENDTFKETYRSLNQEQKSCVEDFQQIQENTRKEIIRDLKAEYFSLDQESPFDLMKIKWKGNRKQLAELFVELEQKKWIEFTEGERKPICNTISRTFVINNSNEKENINIGSFYTTFRPDPNMKPSKYSYVERYDKIFTPQHIISFKDIADNK